MTSSEHPDHRLRVVVADDDPDIRRLLTLVCGEYPRCEVVAVAADGREALEVVAEHHPDVAVIDLDMPVLDGIATTVGIRTRAPGTRIVLCSGDPDVSHRAQEAGVKHFIEKPFGRAAFLSVLGAAAEDVAADAEVT